MLYSSNRVGPDHERILGGPDQKYHSTSLATQTVTAEIELVSIRSHVEILIRCLCCLPDIEASQAAIHVGPLCLADDPRPGCSETAFIRLVFHSCSSFRISATPWDSNTVLSVCFISPKKLVGISNWLSWVEGMKRSPFVFTSYLTDVE